MTQNLPKTTGVPLRDVYVLSPTIRAIVDIYCRYLNRCNLGSAAEDVTWESLKTYSYLNFISYSRDEPIDVPSFSSSRMTVMSLDDGDEGSRAIVMAVHQTYGSPTQRYITSITHYFDTMLGVILADKEIVTPNPNPKVLQIDRPYYGPAVVDLRTGTYCLPSEDPNNPTPEQITP